MTVLTPRVFVLGLVLTSLSAMPVYAARPKPIEAASASTTNAPPPPPVRGVPAPVAGAGLPALLLAAGLAFVFVRRRNGMAASLAE